MSVVTTIDGCDCCGSTTPPLPPTCLQCIPQITAVVINISGMSDVVVPCCDFGNPGLHNVYGSAVNNSYRCVPGPTPSEPGFPYYIDLGNPADPNDAGLLVAEMPQAGALCAPFSTSKKIFMWRLSAAVGCAGNVMFAKFAGSYVSWCGTHPVPVLCHVPSLGCCTGSQFPCPPSSECPQLEWQSACQGGVLTLPQGTFTNQYLCSFNDPNPVTDTYTVTAVLERN